MRMLTAVFLMGLCLESFAQEKQSETWQLSPSVSLGKFFPGISLQTPAGYYDGPIIAMYPSPTFEYRYAGTALNFSVRACNREARNVALTFGAGITWYYDPERSTGGWTSPLAVQGVGGQLKSLDFVAFPIALGLQFIFPYDEREDLMFFAGGEGNLHLISGNVPMSDQAKLGYTLTGGFAVKIVEFGVRYTEFSDMKNLGAYFGFRLKGFAL